MSSTKVRKKKRRTALNIAEPDPRNLPVDPRVHKLVSPYYHALGGYLKQTRRIFPGAAVMVRDNNEVVHVECYGYANLETEQKLTPNTVFDLGSLSKQFTAFAALWLFDEVELQRPLSCFFAGFPRYADEISVRDLIHHLSALPDYMALHGASRRTFTRGFEAIKLQCIGEGAKLNAHKPSPGFTFGPAKPQCVSESWTK
jgi:CubicO group peptidase (beta-lactamase class C family)